MLQYSRVALKFRSLFSLSSDESIGRVPENGLSIRLAPWPIVIHAAEVLVG